MDRPKLNAAALAQEIVERCSEPGQLPDVHELRQQLVLAGLRRFHGRRGSVNAVVKATGVAYRTIYNIRIQDQRKRERLARQAEEAQLNCGAECATIS
jgi:hypothetical protein